MKIIISPAKTMREDPETLPASAVPRFWKEAAGLLFKLKQASPAAQKEIWKCSDRLCELNRERLCAMTWLDGEYPEPAVLTPAILAYEGIQYQYLSPATLQGEALDYLQEHLRVLSGAFGILRPLDGVMPYRLEMQAKLTTEHGADLYDFWGDSLFRALFEEETGAQKKAGAQEKAGVRAQRADDPLIINLASKEYARAVEPYLTPAVRYITCKFVQRDKKSGKLVQRATAAKMARGEMVRWMAESDVRSAEALKNFDRLGYRFLAAASDEANLIFLQEAEETV